MIIQRSSTSSNNYYDLRDKYNGNISQEIALKINNSFFSEISKKDSKQFLRSFVYVGNKCRQFTRSSVFAQRSVDLKLVYTIRLLDNTV